MQMEPSFPARMVSRIYEVAADNRIQSHLQSTLHVLFCALCLVNSTIRIASTSLETEIPLCPGMTEVGRIQIRKLK